MKVRVNYPGYWAHEKVFEGEAYKLTLPDGSCVECMTFEDPNTGYKFALPKERCRPIAHEVELARHRRVA